MPTHERRRRLRQVIKQALTPKNAEARTTPSARTRPGGIDVETARKMLLIDFEQAFILHNDYKDAERDLYKLSLRILAFPVLVAGALVSAKLISSVGQVGTVLRLPIIYAAAVIAGVLNTSSCGPMSSPIGCRPRRNTRSTGCEASICTRLPPIFPKDGNRCGGRPTHTWRVDAS
ncbi:hypothetical protein [Verrucosispora sp. WMMD1129]|uniref:hypothetical protein n=1 Tax=Verrucosispora sp. WMMD1129 TaxID=3016093 RepID=UPI00249A32A9|nr:hypothetical protein [Verrucosispora sp. WMMD1129]WFE43056.1 hypothetical protein O7624_01390 [Verrucosispora sp. WMMD1129]